MLNVSAPFPYPGSTAYIDDIDHQSKDVVERVRIISVDDAGEALISIRSRRYRHEMASGNRRVPLSDLRAQPEAEPIVVAKPARRAKGRRR